MDICVLILHLKLVKKIIKLYALILDTRSISKHTDVILIGLPANLAVNFFKMMDRFLRQNQNKFLLGLDLDQRRKSITFFKKISWNNLWVKSWFFIWNRKSWTRGFHHRKWIRFICSSRHLQSQSSILVLFFSGKYAIGSTGYVILPIIFYTDNFTNKLGIYFNMIYF